MYIVEKYLKICGKLKDISEIRVDNPILWDIDNPYLYSYKIILEKDGEILDEAEDTFGIRKIEADAVHGFRLNGKSMKLKGGCVHHDNGFLGACAYPKAEERKMKIVTAQAESEVVGRMSKALAVAYKALNIACKGENEIDTDEKVITLLEQAEKELNEND